MFLTKFNTILSAQPPITYRCGMVMMCLISEKHFNISVAALPSADCVTDCRNIQYGTQSEYKPRTWTRIRFVFYTPEEKQRLMIKEICMAVCSPQITKV